MHRVLSLKANYLARPGVKPGPHNRGRNSDLLYFAVSCTLQFFPFGFFLFFFLVRQHLGVPPRGKLARDIIGDAPDGVFMEY
jgi:hypothetical protein